MTTLDNEKMIKEIREWEKNIKKRISNKIYDITPLKVAARMGNNEEEMRKLEYLEKSYENNLKVIDIILKTIHENDIGYIDDDLFGGKALFTNNIMMMKEDATVKDVIIEMMTYYQGYFLYTENSNIENKLKNAGAVALLCWKTLTDEDEDNLFYAQGKRTKLYLNVKNNQQYFVSKEKYNFMKKYCEGKFSKETFKVLFPTKYDVCFRSFNSHFADKKRTEELSKVNKISNRIFELKSEMNARIELIEMEYNKEISKLMDEMAKLRGY